MHMIMDLIGFKFAHMALSSSVILKIQKTGKKANLTIHKQPRIHGLICAAKQMVEQSSYYAFYRVHMSHSFSFEAQWFLLRPGSLLLIHVKYIM